MSKIAALKIINIFLTVSLFSAPVSDLWEKWAANNPDSKEAIDHSQWDVFLKKYLLRDTVSGVNLVKYSAISKEDREKLANYIEALQKIKITNYNKNEQFAYWINLYNALTVNLILKNYPLKSITEIKSGWFSFGPWDRKIARVEGEEITLNDIEHRILRPIWKDNRTHYAVNCASMSCPNLQAVAFTSTNADSLLNQAVKAYIDSPRGVEFRNGKLYLSSIYDWYAIDFAPDEKSLIKYLAANAGNKIAAELLKYKGKLYYDYNWNLNEYSKSNSSIPSLKL